MNLFLVPANKDNIGRSIAAPVAWKLLEGNLAPSQVAKIRGQYGDQTPVHCWAMTEGKRGTFSQMQTGDMALFAVKSTGKFNYKGLVALTLECPIEFGNNLWPFIPKDPWTLVYFLKDVVAIDIEKVRLVTDLGYQPNFPVYGAIRVGPERVKALIDSYGSLTKALEAMQAGERPIGWKGLD